MPDASYSLLRDRALMLTAVFGGLLICTWLIWSEDVINRDAVRYIAAAEAIVRGDVAGSFAAFEWPFHSALMAAVHMVTGWPMEFCGYALIPPLHLLTVFAFLGIIRQLGGGRPVCWAALVLILLHPALNNTLPSILRDQGYWAFSLLALLFFVRYWKYLMWRDAAAWTACSVIATLFRIEGLYFLAALPLALALRPDTTWTRRLLAATKAYAPAALLAVMALTATALVDRDVLFLDQGRLLDPLDRAEKLWTSVTTGIAERGQRFGDEFLPRYSRGKATEIMWIAAAYIAVNDSLRGVNWLYLLLAALLIKFRRFKPDRNVLPIIWWAIALNALLLGGFAATALYLSPRYAAGLAFLVMILASFGLASIWDLNEQRAWTSRMQRLVYPAVVAALVIVGLSGLYSTGPNNAYERTAGQWIATNIQPDAQVYFDDLRIRYYADRPYEGGIGHDWPRVLALLESDRLQRYDYVTLRFSRRRPDLYEQAVDLIGSEPIERFFNDHGDSVAIFRVSNENEPPQR